MTLSKNLPLLSLLDVSFGFSEIPLFEHLSLHFYAGDKICLIGKNGSGKSTLFQVILDHIQPLSGTLYRKPGLKIGYMPQQWPKITSPMTALEFVLEGIQHSLTDQEALENKRYMAQKSLQEFNIPEQGDVSHFSGGEMRRVCLARLFAQEHDLILLDEPTNHLDIASIEHLETFLKKRREALLIISHDRTFLETVSKRTFWLVKQNIYTFDRGFSDFDAWSETFLQEEAKRLEALNGLLAQELRWLQRGVTARRKRNQGRLERLEALRKAKRDSQMRVKQSQKKLHLSAQEEAWEGRQLVLEAENLSYRTANRLLISDCSLRLTKGERLGIVGPNGVGKTTLIRLLLGELPPESGTVRIPEALEPLVFRQDHSQLNLDETPWQFLSPYGQDYIRVQQRQKHVMAYLKEFLFDEKQARSPVGFLSGGEKNRLLLAKILANPSECLILDEPTNDLDQDTLDLLQEWLSEYTGTVIIVSHNRDFLDQVASSLLVFEGEGKIREHIGGFSSYAAYREKQALQASKNATIKNISPAKQVSAPQKAAQKKLSFRQSYDLEHLPDRIARLEEEIRETELALGDPGLHAFPEKVRQLQHKISDLHSQRDTQEQAYFDLLLLQANL